MIAWYGALIGLVLAIVLILKKVNPVFSLFLGAIVGALVGGANLKETVDVIVVGTQGVMGTVVRVIAAGVLAGAMMETGAAERIAESIVKGLGDKFAILALALTTMILTAVGVFIPVAVLIVAPIALSVGKKSNISKLALLLALSGGGKAGNVISPNPNTITAATGFGEQLFDVMVGAVVPALVGLLVTVGISMLIKHKGHDMEVTDSDLEGISKKDRELPSLLGSLVAPVIAITLLLINPILKAFNVDFEIDALYVLPIAGVIGIIALGHVKNLLKFTTNGLNRMTGTVMILIGAGAISGLISKSDLSAQVVNIIENLGIPSAYLSPIVGVLMGGAVASTSAGVALGTGSFKDVILNSGIGGLGAAVTMHIGATVIDHLPHGNYFHVTGQSMNLSIGQRMKVVGLESLVALSMLIVSVLMYIVF